MDFLGTLFPLMKVGVPLAKTFFASLTIMTFVCAKDGSIHEEKEW